MQRREIIRQLAQANENMTEGHKMNKQSNDDG